MSLIFDIEDIPESDMAVNLDVDANYFGRYLSEGSLSQGVEVKGTLRKWEQDVFFSGNISALWAGKCSRCLNPVDIPVGTEISVKFMLQEESPDAGSDTELSKSDIDVEYYTENKIDLSQPIYDQIMLSLPLVNLCGQYCQGLCSQCGANLNKRQCACGGQDLVDPRLAVLRTLKNKIE